MSERLVGLLRWMDQNGYAADWPQPEHRSALSDAANVVEELKRERDLAREECGHEKHMRKFNSDEVSHFVKLWSEAKADLSQLQLVYERAVEDLVKMRGRLAYFGQHTPDCKTHLAKGAECNCEWDEIKAAIAEAVLEEGAGS